MIQNERKSSRQVASAPVRLGGARLQATPTRANPEIKLAKSFFAGVAVVALLGEPGGRAKLPSATSPQEALAGLFFSSTSRGAEKTSKEGEGARHEQERETERDPLSSAELSSSLFVFERRQFKGISPRRGARARERDQSAQPKSGHLSPRERARRRQKRRRRSKLCNGEPPSERETPLPREETEGERRSRLWRGCGGRWCRESEEEEEESRRRRRFCWHRRFC
ncbi:Hypothetical predicted protein [Podarcis lilfordi]|uniref:Uncharacterized protein n=1 Tax=Podarcis lilfordi TaxID=74358 RepID=A0AA35PKD5_9SAUR|nr:Hypothetical predicted protein [Podarcis lilfordi]